MTADLTGALRGLGIDADDSPLAKSLYSGDASLYRVEPAVVVRPRNEDELLRTLEAAREWGVAITPRGAGTSIAGNAIGPGIVLDLRRHLNQVLEVDRTNRTARVQPGAVHQSLQRRAADQGLRFGPDPSTHSRCTVGGMIGNNACGSRALAYGRTSDNVESLRVVLADGSVLDHGATAPAALAGLVDDHLALIRTEFGRLARQGSGYALDQLLPENGRRFDRLLVGSEGTLGIVLEATVRLVDDPPARALAILGYDDMAQAADAVPAVLGTSDASITACEGLDRRITSLVPHAPELPTGNGWLFVEVTEADMASADAAARALVRQAGVSGRAVSNLGEQQAFWRIREDGAGLATRSLTRPAHAGWEDAAVPPERLGSYLRDFEALLREHAFDGVPYGHFGDGCVHVRVDFEFGDPTARSRFRRFVEDGADLVARYGGSISGEHGDGRARSELLTRMYSQEAVALMAAVKHVLDPGEVLNPGVLVAPAPLDASIRLADRATGPLADLFDDVHRCTGVGKCLADNTGAGGVMCPSFQATDDEQDSTRGRARVLQDVVTGRLEVTDQAVGDALDLCLACKGCARDCPTGVDMAAYRAKALDARYAGVRRPRSHLVLGRLPQLTRRVPARLANLGLDMGSLAKLVAGVDRRRTLPRLAAVPARKAVRRSASSPDVVLWLDTFSDSFSPDAVDAAVALLERAGQRVAVRASNECCGLTAVSTGQLDRARRSLTGLVRELDSAAETPVVMLEPSCLAVLRDDARWLVGRTSQVRTLAEHLEAIGFSPPDLTGVEVVVQPHCHHASVLGWEADERLLRVSGALVNKVAGCCGMAGNFGMERGHYEISVAIAEQALLPAIRAASPDAVVLADGFSCRTQLTDLGGVRALHLAQLLARDHRAPSTVPPARPTRGSWRARARGPAA